MNNKLRKESSSFRDPSGRLFYIGDKIFRQINLKYKDNFDLFIKSGLYDKLVKDELIVCHEEVRGKMAGREAYKIISPELIPFISYPYEWCFSQLKDAALLTLQIQKEALKYGMILKDASAYNIQFKNGRPILIDTLSFEKYDESKPWIAYGQFCRHFLAPLALSKYSDTRLQQLLRIHIDGIPLDLAGKILPAKAYFNFGLLLHVFLHSRSQQYYSDKPRQIKTVFSRAKLSALIESLEAAVKNLKWKQDDTEWADYYGKTNYSDSGIDDKKKLISLFIDDVAPKTVWDMGANNGLFSRIASNKGIYTISFDIDPVAVEQNYLQSKENKEKNIMPLIMDLFNPSPSLGWSLEERKSLIERSGCDMAFALALIHHLAISNNVPLGQIAEFFGKICNYLIIEFVPKNDSQVKKLLATREDIFDDYNRESFEKEFSGNFVINKSMPVRESKRTLYLMTNKNKLNNI